MVNKVFFTVLQSLLLINNTKQSNIRQTISTFKAIGKTIKSPLLKTISNTIKKPIIKTFGNTMKNSVSIFQRNKSTIKNVAYGVHKKTLGAMYNAGSRPVKYLGEESVKRFKYMMPQAIKESKQLLKTKSKKNIQMRSAEYFKANEFGSLINMVSKSRPQLPFLFTAGSLTQFNLLESGDDLPITCDKYVLEPEGEHKRTQIWLHEMGGTGQDFAEDFLIPQVNSKDKSTKIRLISAQIFGDGGEYVTSWFNLSDKFSKDLNFYNMNDVNSNCEIIKKVIKEEIEQLGEGKSAKVFVGGYMEGAAMALHAGLGYEKTLGGVIGISGFKFKETVTHQKNKEIPIFLANGKTCDNIPYEEVKSTYDQNDWIKNPKLEFHPIEYQGHKVDTDDKIKKLFRTFFNTKKDN